MAYDEELAERVRNVISARADVEEKRMFGGIGFMVGGNLAVGIRGDELLVRLAEEDAQRALTEDGVQQFEMGGKRQPKGWVLVGGERISEDSVLTEWIDAGADYAASLPAK